ncbi:head GIN domain-containing protein [Longibacter salinarum]|nr:head GIN domain-containing protein [Longibacter salinarum]
MNTLRYIVACLLILGISGYALPSASAQQVTETREVDPFTELHIKIPGDVELSQGSEQSVEIVARSQEVMDALDVRVRSNRLVIDGDFDDSGLLDRLFGGGMDSDDLIFRITMTDISALQIDGTGDIIGRTPISTDDLEITVNGTGDVELNVSATTIETRVSGTGDVELSGEADEHDVSISGTGDVEAQDLKTKRTSASISGTGDCVVHATERLDARVSGLGDVQYIGSPAEIETSTSGLGSVEPYND